MEREDLKAGRNMKSLRDIYLQAEKYRQGLSVEMDKDTFAATVTCFLILHFLVKIGAVSAGEDFWTTKLIKFR